MKNDLLRKIYNKKTLTRIEDKIKLLGTSSKYDAVSFLNTRLFTSIILFLFVLCFVKYGYILSIVFVIIYYYMFEKFFLDEKIKKRAVKLDHDAIYFFEVLVLSLQTGRNLVEAVTVTVNGVDSDLSNEFREALRQTKFGKSLTESLTNMQKYIPSDNINNIILTLTQANMYGSSIIDTMYNQVDYLREKRKLEVKAAISKLPTKISIISVFFFIPLILLIVMGPALLTLMEYFANH